MPVVGAADAGGGSYPSGSWGLGVVVPDGSQYENGSRLSWSQAKQIQALVRLPLINYTDNTIYVIMSAMLQDDSVVQVAAGINPNMTSWFAYAFHAQDVQSQNYTLVLNSSKPEMSSGDMISLSIYQSAEKWEYEVDDLRTNESVQGYFMIDPVPPFKSGDQEVFALESYTRSNIVFEHMTSLVLSSLLINGSKVSRGWYSYGDWDSTHNPLFVVGGLSPPAFISTRDLDNGTIEWNYYEWTGSTTSFPFSFGETLLILLAIGVVIVTLVVLRSQGLRKGS
jgi:hypothetical protein